MWWENKVIIILIIMSFEFFFTTSMVERISWLPRRVPGSILGPEERFVWPTLIILVILFIICGYPCVCPSAPHSVSPLRGFITISWFMFFLAACLLVLTIHADWNVYRGSALRILFYTLYISLYIEYLFLTLSTLPWPNNILIYNFLNGISRQWYSTIIIHSRCSDFDHYGGI